jgi:hypothetical protein
VSEPRPTATQVAVGKRMTNSATELIE